MALDGLSNQNVGIYRSKDPSKTTDKLTARSKEMAEIHLSDIEESNLVEKVDPDGKRNGEEQSSKELVLSQANKIIEEEDDKQILQLTLENEDSPVELEYTVKFNSQTKMIEMKNIKTNEMIETIQPEELLKVLSKAKNISGMFIDKQI